MMMEVYEDRIAPAAPRYITALAASEREIQEAQRLRYQVFALEMGANLASPSDGIDRDDFDPHCEHLLVRDRHTGAVVGTYRILTAEGARRAGGYYSAREFDIGSMAALEERVVELGRACVHPSYRHGSVIASLWAGLAAHIRSRGYRYVIGCASIPLSDGGRLAASIYHHIAWRFPSPPCWRATPRCPFPVYGVPIDSEPPMPALLKGYLRLGALVCGEPAWDRDFMTADILLILPTARMNPRYAERFLRHS